MDESFPSRAIEAEGHASRRVDGWTADRQRRFLLALAATRSVSRSAAVVGMSLAGLYKFRRHPGAHDFAAAWTAILAKPREPDAGRPLSPLEEETTPLFRMGKPVGTRRRLDINRALVRMRALDRWVERRCPQEA